MARERSPFPKRTIIAGLLGLVAVAAVIIQLTTCAFTSPPLPPVDPDPSDDDWFSRYECRMGLWHAVHVGNF